MEERQVIGILKAVDRQWIKFDRGLFFSESRHIRRPGKIVLPRHLEWLVGAGLVQPRLRWAKDWTYRLTPLGKKLIDA